MKKKKTISLICVIFIFFLILKNSEQCSYQKMKKNFEIIQDAHALLSIEQNAHFQEQFDVMWSEDRKACSLIVGNPSTVLTQYPNLRAFLMHNHVSLCFVMIPEENGLWSLQKFSLSSGFQGRQPILQSSAIVSRTSFRFRGSPSTLRSSVIVSGTSFSHVIKTLDAFIQQEILKMRSDRKVLNDIKNALPLVVSLFVLIMSPILYPILRRKYARSVL